METVGKGIDPEKPNYEINLSIVINKFELSQVEIATISERATKQIESDLNKLFKERTK